MGIAVALALLAGGAAALSATPVALTRTADAPAGAPSWPVRLDVTAMDARGHPVRDLTPSDFEVLLDGSPQPLDSVRSIDAASRRQPVAIYLDEYHVSAAGAARVRAALERFIDATLRPGDPVIVLKPLDSLLAIPLATDPAAVREVIASFEGRAGDYQPRSAFERDYMARAPAVVDRLRRQVTISALNALAVRLGGLGDGRKAILLVSEGFADAPSTRAEGALPTLDLLVRTANRATVAIYTLDPSGASTGSDALGMLAASTDGRATVDGDRVDAGLQRIASDATAYYLLTWRPAVAADGRFYPLEVRVKRPGVQVRTRKGFWAMTPDEAVLLADARAEPETASVFERTPRHTSAIIRPWFGMARGAAGRTRVTMVWEPGGRVPGDRLHAVAPIAVALQAIARDGTTMYEGTVRPTGVGDKLQAALSKAVFEAAPGPLMIRMAIAGANARQLDVDVRDLAVRDFAAAVEIGTPAVLRARSAREFRALAADLEAVPVAAREFSRAERLLIRFAAYAPPDDVPLVTARLVSRAGGTMRIFAPAELAGLPAMRQIDVPLAGFAPGEYTLEIAVSARAGRASERLTFRVTG